MYRYLTLVAATLFVLTSCCAITSVHPLESVQPTYHKHLTGVWTHEFDEGHLVLHLGKTKTNRIQVLTVEHGKGDAISHEAFTVLGTAIKNHYYLNIDMLAIPEKQRDPQSGHVILKYGLPDPNTLIFSLLKLKPMVAAVQAKKIAGEITYAKASQSGDTQMKTPECVRITDTSANLNRFLSQSEPAKLFSSEMTFKRLR